MHQICKIYFVTKLYMFRASSVPIIRSYQLYTWQLVCFMQVMWPLPRRVRLEVQRSSNLTIWCIWLIILHDVCRLCAASVRMCLRCRTNEENRWLLVTPDCKHFTQGCQYTRPSCYTNIVHGFVSYLSFPCFLVNDQRDAQFFSMYLFLFLTLYMFRAHRARNM
jgi:hypothetical protein